MAEIRARAEKCPTEDLALLNRVIVSAADFPGDKEGRGQAMLKFGPGQEYLVSTLAYNGMSRGGVGFSGVMRKWMNVSLKQELSYKPYALNSQTDYIASLAFEIDFMIKSKSEVEAFNTDKMAQEALMSFPNAAFTIGMPVVFSMPDRKPRLILTVKEIDAMSFGNDGVVRETFKTNRGVLTPNSSVIFEKAPDSSINLSGKSKTKAAHTSIINPEWNFEKMGIGGLGDEFNAIFRRAFASRVFPADIVEQLGIKHCRGILLYGPPGTGKTLMARQIGKMLNAREPKIVNGPQILDKFVGESEANIRRLFAEAEEEEKRCGIHSGLHIIIFDEIDAICKSRGSVSGSTQVHDTVVNQLLSKIDGVDQLNNILVLGMTNRRDMIDEALLRPGRLEVQMEIGLPKEPGRVEILNIHTSHLREHQKLAPDVNIEFLAANTKNFSGAELEGLVRAAAQTAMNKLIKVKDKVEISQDAIEKLQVTMEDFHYSLAHDVKPAFGSSEDQFNAMVANGIVEWGEPVSRVLQDGALLVAQVKNSQRTPFVSLLVEGPPNSGKTALAAQIAKVAGFPFVKVCSPDTLIGFHEAAKSQAIKKVFDDAYRSPLSCIIIDDIERLLDYAPIGPRFSNLVLQTIIVLLKKQPPPNRKLMVIGTTSRRDVLEELEMVSAFSASAHISNISTGDQCLRVVEDMGSFTQPQRQELWQKLGRNTMFVGVKKLLALMEMSLQMDVPEQTIKFRCLLEEEGRMMNVA